MTFLIIEYFNPDKVKELYQRLAQEGRHLPDGVVYVNSWVDLELKTCYQIMEAENLGEIQAWLVQWEDFATFKVIPVMDSNTAKSLILSL